MGASFSSYGAKNSKVYMRCPELDAPDMHAQVCELISEIGEFEPAGIVSLGPVGVGKSSNLNTIASYLSNRLEQEAAAGSGASTLTVSCRSHVISYQGRPVKWKWMDTPGDLFTTLVEKWKRTELSEMNDGYVSQAEYEKHLDEAVLKQLQAQQIGCVMAMISAVELASQTSRTPGVDRLVVPPGSRLSCHLQVLKHLYRQLVRKGLRMICVITKVDLVDEEVADDVACVQTSFVTHLMRQCVSQNTGLPMNQVHPVVNLVNEFDPQANLPLGHLALFNVRSALRASSHANLPPVPPNTMPEHNWNTLTFPSPITSDDGRGGRSFPVGMHVPPVAAPSGDRTPPTMSPGASPAVSFPSLPQPSIPDLSASVGTSQVSPSQDIDLQLLHGVGQTRPKVTSISEANGSFPAAPNQIDGSPVVDSHDSSS